MPMKRHICVCRLLAAAFGVSAASVAYGTVYTWTGKGVAGNWSDSANWSPSTGFPGAGDVARMDASASVGGETVVIPQPIVVTSPVSIGEGVLEVRIGAAVTNVICGAISGPGGIKVVGSCETSALLKETLVNAGKWTSALFLAGRNSYEGGTSVTNAFLRGDTASAFGAADSAVVFGGRTSISLNAPGTWTCYRYRIGATSGDVAIQFNENLDWYGGLEIERPSGNVLIHFLGNKGKTVDFRSPIGCARAKIYMSVGSGGLFNFHEPVCINTFSTAGSPSGIGGFSCLHAQGNTYESTQIGYTFNVRCMADRVLDESRVVNWGGSYTSATTGWLDMNGHDQRAKGLTSTAAVDKNGRDYNEIGCYLGNKASTPATMHLVGAGQDCLFRGVVTDDVSVVWAPLGDYVQTFSNRVHGTTGRLVVSNGTMRIAGTATFKRLTEIVVCRNSSFECLSTEADCLAGLRSLVIEDGATFVVGSGTPKPFADGVTDLKIRGTGKIAMPSTMSVEMRTTRVNGCYPVGDEPYGSSETWIDGGVVWVGNANLTAWKSATDGRWSDAANWTAGVPSGSQTACISAEGGCYTVTMDEDSPLGAELAIGNDGDGTARLAVNAAATMTNGCITVGDNGVIEVGQAGSLLYCGKGGGVRTADAATEVVTVKGGELRVSGGTVDFSEMAGRIVVAAGERGRGSITMNGGRVRHLPDTADDLFRVEEGGLVDMAAGTFDLDYNAGTAKDNDLAGFRLAGGELCVTGGVFGVVARDATHTNNVRLNFHSGKAFFGGTSTLRLNEESRYEWKSYFAPDAEGGSLSIRFEDQAKVSPADFRVLPIGGGADGVDVAFDWATAGHDDGNAVYRALVGFDRSGTYVMNITNSTFNVGPEGIRIGVGWQAGEPSAAVRGVLDILDGGTLVVDGVAASMPGYTSLAMSGLVVGYSCRTLLTSGRMYDGALNVRRGGEARVMYGDVGVGVGFAKGVVTVDGGTFTFNDHDDPFNKKYSYRDRTCGIGLFGGEGAFIAKNGGVVSALPSVFVGGAATNRYPVQGFNFLSGPSSSSNRMPADHSATGTLVVADAAVTLKSDLVLGMDGFGVVRRIGSYGTFTVGNLVCTNIADAACTGSRLEFVFDENGIGSLDVTNAVSVFGNAKVNIDMSAYAGRRRNFRLIGCRTHTGEFDEMTVTGVNLPNSSPVVEWTRKGLYLRMGVGMAVSFR